MENVDVVLDFKLIEVNVRIVVHANVIVNHVIMKVLVVMVQNIHVMIVTAQDAIVISKKKLFFLFFPQVLLKSINLVIFDHIKYQKCLLAEIQLK